MISRCEFTEQAAEDLREVLGLYGHDELEGLELEFREVPYFIVSRSREAWSPEQGDINVVRVLGATDLGIIVDPDSRALATDKSQGRRHTFVPWTNILSITVARTEHHEN